MGTQKKSHTPDSHTIDPHRKDSKGPDTTVPEKDSIKSLVLSAGSLRTNLY
jgi:hypothetical protein